MPFGLPGVNKAGKVSNGNYLWISYFYSYLSEKGRAGFVMSSQSSSAGRDEASVRRHLVETGHVDAMVAIRSNFFYTRTVPCELWFFDKAKPKERQDFVLMLDARNVYRKVTRKIYDFSPEQLANLSSIVWLYRGQSARFLQLVGEHLQNVMHEARASIEPLKAYLAQARKLAALLVNDAALKDALATFAADVAAYEKAAGECAKSPIKANADNATLHKTSATLAPLSEQSRDLIKDADHLYKLAVHAIDALNGEENGRELSRVRKDADDARKLAVEALKQVRYFHRQAVWLQERFPDAELRDVPGLVKLASRTEIEENDWSLTPGRYVGVAPEEVDENFDFEATLKDIHIELKGLNEEAIELAARISRNFEELGA